MTTGELEGTLRDIVRGAVHRSRHDLVVDGVSVVEVFRRVLAEEGYRPERVRDLKPAPGVRHPAFVVRGTVAYFGYLFQEKFEERSRRVLFGSAARTRIGDWEIMLTRRSPETVWVRLEESIPFDEDRPSSGL